MNNLDTTQELNAIQRFFGKIELELETEPVKFILFYALLPYILGHLLLAHILLQLPSPFVSPFYVWMLAWAFVFFLYTIFSILEKSETWKERLPEYQVEQARHRLKQLTKQAKEVTLVDPMTIDTNTVIAVVRLIADAQNEIEKNASAPYDLESIQRSIEELEELICEDDQNHQEKGAKD